MKLVMKTLKQLLMNKTKNKITIINRELKESIRMINVQRRDVEKVNLTEEGKKDRY